MTNAANNLKRLASFLVGRKLKSANLSDDSRAPPFPSLAFEERASFLSRSAEFQKEFEARRQRELELAGSGQDPISYPGHCGVCDEDVSFTCDWSIFYTHAGGAREPVWRERLVCSNCGLNSRLRAALQFMKSTAGLSPESHVYLSEQTTPFYGAMGKYCDNVVGSEFLRDGTAKGAVNGAGIRHEDVTDLSFDDASFDIVGSFEVLEHVPDYRAGLREMCRVLRPGGHLVATFPFRSDLYQTLVRAQLSADGEIEHLLPPEYHGDPLDDQGVLCFYHFGWDILDAMRDAGFSKAACHYYWSWDAGYLGGALPQFHAVKE